MRIGNYRLGLADRLFVEPSPFLGNGQSLCSSFRHMAQPSDRRRVGKALAGVVKEYGTSINIDALANELAESLIPAQHLERFARAIIDSANEPAPSPGLEQASRSRPALGPVGPTPEEMRREALGRITTATGSTPTLVGDHGTQVYRSPGGPRIYLRTSNATHLQGDHKKYWFGLDVTWFDDHSAFFVLQCGVDFTLVVPVVEWIPFRDSLGHASNGTKRQPHVHLDGAAIELREHQRGPNPFNLDLTPWVDTWGPLTAATRSTPA